MGPLQIVRLSDMAAGLLVVVPAPESGPMLLVVTGHTYDSLVRVDWGFLLVLFGSSRQTHNGS